MIANNIARDSENKMHDDAVAKTLGFAGGLVPGIAVFGYMSHLPVATWGRAFLERGLMEARFVKPVYDGDEVRITAEETKSGIALELHCRDTLCATGHASLPAEPAVIALRDFEKVAPVSKREPVDTNSYPVDAWLGTADYVLTEDAARTVLHGLRETDTLYEQERLAHPGHLLRMMNQVLMENAILAPWIHVSSKVRYLATADATDALSTRARVTANEDRKGHKFVELDGIIVANDTTPIAHCQHVAIYKLRA